MTAYGTFLIFLVAGMLFTLAYIFFLGKRQYEPNKLMKEVIKEYDSIVVNPKDIMIERSRRAVTAYNEAVRRYNALTDRFHNYCLALFLYGFVILVSGIILAIPT